MSSNNSTLNNIQGHAQYALGATKSAVASATGSDEWAHAADKDKQEGVQTIRDASSSSSTAAPAEDNDSLAAKACPVAGGGVGQPATSQ